VRFRKEPHEWDGIPAWSWPRVARVLPRACEKPFLKALRKGGRPRSDDRLALSAILWRLRCDGTWSGLPRRFGSAATARRRLALWSRGNLLEQAWRAYLNQQSRAELERWRDAFLAGAIRRKPSWRFGLDYVWRMEYAPLVSF
jgi:transposase